MPAVTADTLTLPRLSRPAPDALPRPVAEVLGSRTAVEGEGFVVRRPFRDVRFADPFILFDHLGAVEYAPGEARGAPDHPHRGFETVTYIMDGAMEHRDSTGGGGMITNGSTQWMTAGSGIVHSEMPPADLVSNGGLFHGVQLWVNLPRADKWAAPRYQDIGAGSVKLLASHDGGAIVRLIAGDLDGHAGPGNTHTPIAYAHATIAPGARLEVSWPGHFNALVYALNGRGSVGAERRPLDEGHLAHFGDGDHIIITADDEQPANSPALDVLLLGGKPIGEPVVQYGPFVMNTQDEIVEAFADYRAGKMGVIPPLARP